MSTPRTQNKSILWGVFCLGFSVYLMLVALGIVEAGETETAPSWILALCAFAVGACGVALCTEPDSRVRLAAVGVLLLGMGGIGAWASLFSDAKDISGGIPFVPDEVNVAIARFLFGFGSVCCLCLMHPLLRDFQRVGKK